MLDASSPRRSCVLGSPPSFPSEPSALNELSRDVIGHAMWVHSQLGPGLLELPYRIVLADRLSAAGYRVEVERPLPLEVGGRRFDVAYRADIVVDGMLLVEVKAVEDLHIAHIMQAKTYLRLGGYPLGLVLNFHAPKLYLGIRRVVP